MESTRILPTGEQSFPCMGGAVGTAGTLWPAPPMQKGRVFPQSRLAESGWGLLQTLTVITLTTGPRVSEGDSAEAGAEGAAGLGGGPHMSQFWCLSLHDEYPTLSDFRRHPFS